MKYNRITEQCEYCDVVHHPMMRWVHPRTGETVFIHQVRIVDLPDGKSDLVIEEVNPCSMKAAALGFVKRPDLTPKR